MFIHYLLFGSRGKWGRMAANARSVDRDLDGETKGFLRTIYGHYGFKK